MKQLIHLCLIIWTTIPVIAQTTAIPDPAFESKLIMLGIDTNGMTGNILNSDAEGVVNLNVSNSGISDLTGIEAFVDLELLDCEDNSISSLNLNLNTMLVNVDCNNNQLTSLNVQGCANLVVLGCQQNNLTALDLSSNPSLNALTCSQNNLTSLDVFSNANLYQIIAHDNNLDDIIFPENPTSLEIVWVYNNSLTSIDLTNAPILATLRFENNALSFLDLRNGNNTNIHTMDARMNPDLELICVDDINYALNEPLWTKDPTATYSETCILGIDDLTTGDVSLFPNPAKEQFFVATTNGSSILHISIWSVAGNRMITKETSPVDISGLKSGLYFVKISLENGRSEVHKLIRE